MEIIAYGRFTKEMNLFSATFELVLSERRTSSQQAENKFKISRDALLSLRGLGHGRVALLRDRWEWGMLTTEYTEYTEMREWEGRAGARPSPTCRNWAVDFFQENMIHYET